LEGVDECGDGVLRPRADLPERTGGALTDVRVIVLEGLDERGHGVLGRRPDLLNRLRCFHPLLGVWALESLHPLAERNAVVLGFLLLVGGRGGRKGQGDRRAPTDGPGHARLLEDGRAWDTRQHTPPGRWSQSPGQATPAFLAASGSTFFNASPATLR